MKIKTVNPQDRNRLALQTYPNYSVIGGAESQKTKEQDKATLLVKCGPYVYNVSSNPDIYYYEAH